MSEIVEALDVEGWNMSLHPSRPKLTIWCGACHASYTDRPAGHGHRGRVYSRCKHCGELNDTGLTAN